MITHTSLSVFDDGNCLYCALSRELVATEYHHVHVRLLTALEVAQNKELYDFNNEENVDLVGESRVFHD